jgi:hypothetical protein
MKRLLAVAVTTYFVLLVLVITARPASTARALDGKQIFRFDTFGDEQLWTDALQLQRAVAALKPVDALGAGLKVDIEALPPAIIDALEADAVNLEDPAVTGAAALPQRRGRRDRAREPDRRSGIDWHHLRALSLDGR